MSASDPCFEFEELLTFYALHPDERDILVEGQVDRAVITWFLRAHGHRVDYVYHLAERVESVPPQVLDRAGLTGGTKNELLALAGAIDESAPQSQSLIAVDADYDRSVKPIGEISSRVLSTDFPSIEVYFIDEYILESFLRLVLLLSDERIGVSSLINAIDEGLRSLFTVRWTLSEVDPPTKLLKNRRRRMSYRSGKVAVDDARLARDSLAASGVSFDQIEIDEKIRTNALRVKEFDLMSVVHGHDIADVLGFWISKALSGTELEGKQDLKKAENVRSALLGCADAARLSQYPFFARLLREVAKAD